MSAIQKFFRTLRSSSGSAGEGYSDGRRREILEEFERSGVLLSGRGIVCFGAGHPRPANSRKGRILI